MKFVLKKNSELSSRGKFERSDVKRLDGQGGRGVRRWPRGGVGTRWPGCSTRLLRAKLEKSVPCCSHSG